MIINHNLQAMNTHRQLGISNAGGAKSMEKLSSGYRINRAGDDAAGLAISEKMRGQIRGLNQASRNAQDGISLIQTAEGALDETHAILQRMRELAVQSSTDTNTDADRANIQDEIDQLSTEITRISETTEFNTMNLLDGSFKDKKFHIGANEGQDLGLKIGDMSSETLKIEGDKFSKALDGALAGLDLVSRGDNKTLEITMSAAASGANNITKEFEISVNSTGAVTVKFRAAEAAVSSAANPSADKPAITAGTITAEQLAAELEKLGYKFEGELTRTAAVGATSTVTKTELKDADKLTDQQYGINVSTQGAASKGITTINSALETVSKERSKLGAVQNRLEHTIKNLDTSTENLQASEARIRDVDMAKEMMEQTKQNILQQASTAMLAQANQAPQNVLQLLR